MIKKSVSPREMVAREAASLLYFGREKEFRQAKLKAAKNLGVHVLPSNSEVSLALDQIAEDFEGTERTERLIRMRIEALEVMRRLEQYRPILIGSVWRGNIHRGSDIDIEVFHDEPEEIITRIKDGNLKVLRSDRMAVTVHGKLHASHHIYAESFSGNSIEIVIRDSEEAGTKRVCDLFGDLIVGLNIRELEKLIAENAQQHFVPI